MLSSCCILTCIYIYIYTCIYMQKESQRHDNKDEGRLLKKKISHFIWKVRKGFYCERELETEQRLQYIDPHSYGHQRCVFLVLQGCSTRGPEAHSAVWWLSLPHLVSNSSDLQLSRGPRGPPPPGGGFLNHILSLTSLVPNSLISCLTELYNSSIAHSIAHSIFGMACLIIIKRK